MTLTFAYDKIFPSFGTFLDAVEATRDRDGAYGRLGEQYIEGDRLSVEGMPLQDLIPACRNLTGFDNAITDISAMVRTLSARVDMRAVESIKRQRTTGRNGYALNIHAVNRGKLSHAWKRMSQTRTTGDTVTCGVLLPLAFTDGTDPQQVYWTLAANIALVAALEQSGRACDVWMVAGNESVFGKHGGHRELIHAKTSGQHWSVRQFACFTERTLYLRACLRLCETMQPRYTISSGYGGRAHGFWPRCLSMSATRLGYTPAQTIFGADCMTTDVTTAERAQQWLRTTLQPFVRKEP